MLDGVLGLYAKALAGVSGSAEAERQVLDISERIANALGADAARLRQEAEKAANCNKKEAALQGRETVNAANQSNTNDTNATELSWRDQTESYTVGYLPDGTRLISSGYQEPELGAPPRAIADKPEDLEKFERLEKILEHILVEDEAFSKNCQDLSRGLSTEKIVKLQTHMNACLLFTEGQNAADATGMERSIGFKKLHKAILKAMEGDSIELKAMRSGEKNSRLAGGF